VRGGATRLLNYAEGFAFRQINTYINFFSLKKAGVSHANTKGDLNLV
jgi:hypothetical protein